MTEAIDNSREDGNSENSTTPKNDILNSVKDDTYSLIEPIERKNILEYVKDITDNDNNCLHNIFDLDEITGEIIVRFNNINFLKVLYTKIYNLHMGSFNSINQTEIEIKNGDRLEIRTNGLYKNGTVIFKTPEKGWEKLVLI